MCVGCVCRTVPTTNNALGQKYLTPTLKFNSLTPPPPNFSVI